MQCSIFPIAFVMKHSYLIQWDLMSMPSIEIVGNVGKKIVRFGAVRCDDDVHEAMNSLASAQDLSTRTLTQTDRTMLKFITFPF